jgi:uncharacterized protein YaiI (UPF0178 family)
MKAPHGRLWVRIWIDNDGCPKAVRELVYKTALRRDLRVTVVGNSYAVVPPHAKMVCVPGSFDAADDHIAEHVEAGDLVITSDVPLAGRIVAKGALGLSSHGAVFDKENIGERLATRNLLAELRSGGEVTGGPPPFGDAEKKRFADALDRLVAKLAPR